MLVNALGLPCAVNLRNHDIESVTLQDIESHKLVSTQALDQDLRDLNRFYPVANTNSFAGNTFLYHYQFKNLLKCRRSDGYTLAEVWADPEQRQRLLKSTQQRNRGGSTASNIFECFRVNAGSIVMFKATTAKYLYHRYQARSVLDPTAGWGGRMLGAWSLGIAYTGIDTNIAMKPAYNNMIDHLTGRSFSHPVLEVQSSSALTMIWDDCLSVDFGSIDYDFVLTSPPYVNLELYEHMVPWSTDQEFYQNFLIPLWHRCYQHIGLNKHIAFNISPKMYELACKFGLPAAHDQHDLLQQMGQKSVKLRSGQKKQDKIYVWKKV